MSLNMITFSEYNFEKSDERCEKHDMDMIIFGGRPICPICAKELTELHEKEIVHAETVNYYNRDKRFINRSIYTDGTLKRATFETFKTVDDETTANKLKARKLAGSYLKGANFNTIFTGKVGTGKSHLAKAMLEAVNDHAEPQMKCLFVSVDELISLLRYGYNNQDAAQENELRRLCVDADLLVMDDLGAEVGAIGTERAASNDNVRLINAIVTGRMDKPTIFTTNLDSRQIHRLYDQRIASRILKGVNADRIIKFEKTKDKRNQIDF